MFSKFIAVLFIMTSGLAISTAASEPNSIAVSSKHELCAPFNTGSKNCAPELSPLLEARLDSLKLKCKSELKVTPECTALSASLSASDREKKLNTCSTQDVCSEKTLAQQMDEGCLAAFNAFGKEALETLEETWKQMRISAACNSSLSDKYEMFRAYNQAVPTFLQRPVLPEQTLTNMNCSEISRVLTGFSDNTQKVFNAKLLAFENQHPAAKGDLSKYPADLAQYKDWIDANGRQQTENFKKTMAAITNLPGQVAKLLRDLGINLQCYNAKATTELICYGTAATISLVASTVVGGAAAKAAVSASKYLMLLADASGSTKVVSAVLAMQKQENMAQKFLAAKRAGDSEEKVAKLKTAADSAKGKALDKATALSDSERVHTAELLVNNSKTLTVAESNALEAAHLVGKAEGHTYYTYTPAELKTKLQILQDGGFTRDQANRLLRNGIAGTYSVEQVANAATAIGATLPQSASSSVMTYEYANQLKVKRALKAGTNIEAAKTLIDDTLEKLTQAATTGDQQGVMTAKKEWLQLKYLQDRGLKDLSVDELKAMKKDLESKFPEVHPRWGVMGDTPKELAAERELLKNVEDALKKRPQVQEAQAADLQRASESFKANRTATETRDRASQANSAAHPLNESETAEVRRLTQALKTQPETMTQEQVRQLDSLTARVNEKRSWKDEKYSGMTASDNELVQGLETARKEAAAKIAGKSASAINLAESQGRTVGPAHIVQNQPTASGGTVAKSVQLARASTDDTRKIMDSLRAVQTPSVPENFVQFKPVITERKVMDDLERNLKPLGITRDQIESANVVSTGNPADLRFVSNQFDSANKLYKALEEAQRQGRVTEVYRGLSPDEQTALKNLVQTLKFHREHYVPSHLNNL